MNEWVMYTTYHWDLSYPVSIPTYFNKWYL